MRLLDKKYKLLIIMLLIIISSTLTFSTTMANEISDQYRTANLDESILINGTNPRKHLLSDIEADSAAQMYSRINSILRYDTYTHILKCLYLNSFW